jgi:hypothetical protein
MRASTIDMNPSTHLTKIEAPSTIREYLEIQRKRKAPVHLIIEGHESPMQGNIIAVRVNSLEIECPDMQINQHNLRRGYSLVGSLQNGSSFLVCGEIDFDTDKHNVFELTFPKWVDVAQSRESFRCPAPSGHFVHLTSPDRHLNDIVCKLHDISSDGIAFEWSASNGFPSILNSISDYAILRARSNEVHLGSLRVVHITVVNDLIIVGCTFVTNAPKQLDAIVMNAQRAHRKVL